MITLFFFINNIVVIPIKCVAFKGTRLAFCNFALVQAKKNHFDRFKLFRTIKNKSQVQENIQGREDFVFKPNSFGGVYVLFRNGFVLCYLG